MFCSFHYSLCVVISFFSTCCDFWLFSNNFYKEHWEDFIDENFLYFTGNILSFFYFYVIIKTCINSFFTNLWIWKCLFNAFLMNIYFDIIRKDLFTNCVMVKKCPHYTNYRWNQNWKRLLISKYILYYVKKCPLNKNYERLLI